MPAIPSDRAPDRAPDLAPVVEHPTVRLPVQRPNGVRGTGHTPTVATPPPGRRAPLALAATVTTTWAALVSFTPMLVVVVLAYLVDSAQAPVGRVMRLGLAAWLLAHGVPVPTELGAIGLVPLAFTIVAGWRVIRAGVHTTRAVGARRGRSPWTALRIGLAVGAVYGTLGAAAAAVARMPGMAVPVPRAALTLAAFGLAGGGLGALIEGRVLHRWVARLPGQVRDGLRAGVIAALLVLGAGAAAAGMAVALAAGEASQMMADYHTGAAGQAGLTLVCLLYAPNVATWSASYLIGPGFHIGSATSVSVAHVTLGPLPAVPVLAGLPSGPSSGVASLLLVVPLAAGMAAGWLLARRRMREAAARARAAVPDGYSRRGVIGAAALAGPVAGLLLGAVSLASSGPLGNGALAHIGPRVEPVALVAAAVVAVGAITAAGAKLLLGVRDRPAA